MKIRAALLAGAAVLALAGPARAAIPVIDEIQATQGWQTLANWASELRFWVSQLTAMQQQLQSILGVYNSIAHAPSVIAGLENALGVVGFQDVLPINPWAVQTLISGHNTSFAGISGAIGGLVNSSWASNNVYTPEDGSFASQMMIARANGLAGVQGLAQRLYQSITDDQGTLTQLHDAIVGSSDLKDTADLQVRYQLVEANMQRKIVQFQAVAEMARTQQAVWQQQADEHMAQSLAMNISAGAARGY